MPNNDKTQEVKVDEQAVKDETISEVTKNASSSETSPKKASDEEKEDIFDIDDIDVDDVYPDQAKDMIIEMDKKNKAIVFKISDKVGEPFSLDSKITDFVVSDSPSKCWTFDKKVKDELVKIKPFKSVLVTLHYPEEVKGMNNKLIYKNYITYVKNSSTEMEKWAESIQSNIAIIKTLCSDAEKNVSYLNTEEGWFGDNSSERRAMYSIRKNGASAMKALDLDLKSINNQLSTLRIVSESSKSKRDLLVREYLTMMSDLKLEKQRLKFKGEAEARQASFDKKTAKLLADNKTSLENQRKEFLAIIKKNAEEHKKAMDDLNDKHQLKIDEMIAKAKKDLEQQALRFQRVLDDVNKKNAEAIKELHVFYENKIKKLTEAFEKTIADLKEVIKNYEIKLEEANKLIAKYYDALDASQKSQADMLLEFKNISKDKVNAIQNVLKDESVAVNSLPKPVTAANAVLTGSLGLNASLGALNEKEEAIEKAAAVIAKEKKEKEEKEEEATLKKQQQDNYMKIGAGAAILSIVSFVFLKKEQQKKDPVAQDPSDVEVKKKKKKKKNKE